MRGLLAREPVAISEAPEPCCCDGSGSSSNSGSSGNRSSSSIPIRCHRRRSPAEGAYSEGFISSKLNQEYCIECPGTGSTFDFRSGEIVNWYPTNMVLRLLTPKGTCRNLETYPVRLEQVRISPFIFRIHYVS